MDVLTFETRWAVNSEIIKQVTSSWSIFIQVARSVCASLEILFRETEHSPSIFLAEHFLPLLKFPTKNCLPTDSLPLKKIFVQRKYEYINLWYDAYSVLCEYYWNKSHLQLRFIRIILRFLHSILWAYEKIFHIKICTLKFLEGWDIIWKSKCQCHRRHNHHYHLLNRLRLPTPQQQRK